MTTMLPDIERALRLLRLSGVRDTLETRVLQAQGTQQPFLETFALILQDELDRRQSRLIERRYQQSGLEEKLTLAEFDWSFNPKVPRQACFQLHALKFIAEGKNALIIGKPGTGKSHVAKAVAYHAVQHGHKVQYLETDDFFNRYALSAPAQRETRFRAILECDLLVLDDLFLSRTIPDDASALLQTLIHQRYKLHRSVVVTSNRLVQDWGTYLGDNTMSTTILDRLMHHCHLLEFDGRSYRLKEAAETLARKTKES
ncbi:IS21-like element helper ATPase IstB (plasmid) [Paraburkholderia sp. FT54]|uniref:IS21-like element helper ATPase IstB n=1 Tax=Paraburkholderia sp. FT54 TaxID=3074437 RepID=UPI00287736E5|nr:IS21-like element helper ATPase IstB [Paraburkholderia sp. FT54]WNC95148.1 IS21-like element helper ATPase IstB [Paraburkholderia sp. FT54]